MGGAKHQRVHLTAIPEGNGSLLVETSLTKDRVALTDIDGCG